jgi:hypothetical protein
MITCDTPAGIAVLPLPDVNVRMMLTPAQAAIKP